MWTISSWCLVSPLLIQVLSWLVQSQTQHILLQLVLLSLTALSHHPPCNWRITCPYVHLVTNYISQIHFYKTPAHLALHFLIRSEKEIWTCLYTVLFQPRSFIHWNPSEFKALLRCALYSYLGVICKFNNLSLLSENVEYWWTKPSLSRHLTKFCTFDLRVFQPLCWRFIADDFTCISPLIVKHQSTGYF